MSSYYQVVAFFLPVVVVAVVATHEAEEIVSAL